MADIQNLLQQLLNAVYGKDVRQAIHDAIQQCYEDSAGGIAPVITTAKVALGTEVTVTVGGNATKFTVLNGVASSEDVQTYVNAYLEEHPEFVTSVADGSISPEKTSFFKKTLVDFDEKLYTFSEIANGAIEGWTATNGYYISQISHDYSILKATEGADNVTLFKKVKAGDTIRVYGINNNYEANTSSGAYLLSEENYNIIMEGYQANYNSAIDWTNFQTIADTKVTGSEQINLSKSAQFLLDVYADYNKQYSFWYEFTAPSDGYVLVFGSNGNYALTNTGTIYNSISTYEHTLEETLKNDPLVGEQMQVLLNRKFDTEIKSVQFDFSAMVDAITANTDTSAVLEKLTEPFGTLQYVGGICVNKKIYCVPNTADNILVYDTENEYYYKIATGLGSQAFKWTGFVAWNGFLYAIPRGVNQMLQVDPVTDEVKIIELGTTYTVTPYGDYRDSHHYCGIISDGGFLYSPPTYYSNPTSDKLLKVNMNDFSWVELDFPIGCSGAVKHPTEDKIIFLGSGTFYIWDCSDDTYEEITAVSGCFDMVYDQRFPDYLFGVYPNHVFALNLNDYSIIKSDYYNHSTGYGITLGVDGKLYHLEGRTAYCFTFDGYAFYCATITTSESVGTSTPVLAGQAIANNGDIYGIPASGSMTRLKFSGVTRKLPDYIVSSQYYGKY